MKLRTSQRLGFAGLVLIALGFLGFRALLSDTSLRFAAERLTKRLQQDYGLVLEVGEIQVQTNEAKVVFSPVWLLGSDNQELFRAERIAIELSPLQLFSRRLQLKSLEIDSPNVFLRVHDGQLQGIESSRKAWVDTNDAPEKTEPLFQVDVETFFVHGGRVAASIQDVAVELDGIRMEMKGAQNSGQEIQFHVQRSEVLRPADRIELQAFGGRLEVQGQGLLSPERIHISDLTVTSPAGIAHLDGKVELGKIDEVPGLDLHISSVLELRNVVKHIEPNLETAGTATIGVRFLSPRGGKDWSVSGQAELASLEVAKHPIGNLRGHFSATPIGVDLPSLSVETADGLVDASASIDFDDSLSYRVSALSQDFSLYHLLKNLGLRSVWTDLRLDGLLDGHGQILPSFWLEGHFDGEVNDLRVASRDVGNLSANELVLSTAFPIQAQTELRLEPDELSIDGVFFDGFTRAAGTARVAFTSVRGMDLQVEADQIDFASIKHRIGSLDYRGAGGGRLEIHGPYSDIDIEATAWIRDFRLDDFAFGDLAGQIRSKRGILGFQELVARKNTSLYRGDVELDFARPQRSRTQKSFTAGFPQRLRPIARAARNLHIAVNVDVEQAQAEDLRSVIPARYQDGVLGFIRTLSLRGPIRGNATTFGYIGGGRTELLQGDGKLEIGAGAQLYDQSLAHGTGSFTQNLDAFYIDGLDLEFASGQGTAKAKIERESGLLSGSGEFLGVDLHQLDALPSASTSLQGTLAGQFKLGGLARSPDIAATTQLKGLAYDEITLGEGRLSLSHRNRVLQVDGTLYGGRGKLSLTSNTRSPYPYSASLELAGGDATPLFPPNFLPENTSVRLGGKLDVNGSLTRLSDSRGTLALHPLDIAFGDLKLSAVGDVLTHFRSDTLTIDQLELGNTDGNRLQARGELDSSRMDLQLSGQANLSLFPNLFGQLDNAKGELSFDVALTGDLGAPAMNGRGRVKRAELSFQRLEQPLRNVEALLQFQGQQLQIESASAKLGDAPIRGRGIVTLDGIQPATYDLDASFENLGLRIPAWLPTRSNGRISLRGPAQLPTLSGEVELLQASYQEDFDWDRLLPKLRKRVVAPQVFDKADEDVRFDLHLVADRGITVENNAIELEAKGDLFLTGTEERPGLLGNLSLIRGNANFRSNRYRLIGGTIEFTDSYKIAPVLHLETETRVKDFDITARIAGPIENPRLILSSRPQLAEIDILALLTFGFTQFELRDANASAGSAGLEVVSAYTGLEREVRRMVPEAIRQIESVTMDELRLTSQFSSRQGANLPAVAVGFEVNPGFWALDGSRVRLQTTLLDVDGNGTEQRVEWEKRFENDVRLRMVWSSQARGVCPSCVNSQLGDLGGDLWYRWEF